MYREKSVVTKITFLGTFVSGASLFLKKRNILAYETTLSWVCKRLHKSCRNTYYLGAAGGCYGWHELQRRGQ